MSFLNRLLPWLTSLIIAGIFWQIIEKPDFIYWLTPVLFIIIFFVVWQLTGRKIKSLKFWSFLITPVLFLASELLFIIFLEGRWLRYSLIVILALLLGLFLENLFVYFYSPKKYQPYSLQNISSYLNLITYFLATSGIFGLIIFLGLPLGFLALIILAISVLLIYQIIWISNIPISKSWLYILIITLILVEGFWVIGFLPTSIYVNGLILALIYYLTTGLARNWLLGILEKSVVKRYLLIGGLALILILVTAKWS